MNSTHIATDPVEDFLDRLRERFTPVEEALPLFDTQTDPLVERFAITSQQTSDAEPVMRQLAEALAAYRAFLTEHEQVVPPVFHPLYTSLLDRLSKAEERLASSYAVMEAFRDSGGAGKERDALYSQMISVRGAVAGIRSSAYTFDDSVRFERREGEVALVAEALPALGADGYPCMCLVPGPAGRPLWCNASTAQRCTTCGRPVCESHFSARTLTLHNLPVGSDTFPLCQDCARLPREQLYRLHSLRLSLNRAQPV